MELTNALALGYVDPAREGQIITFICPHAQTLNGSNSATCMGNGEWEPDPGEVECIGGMGTTGVITSGKSALSVTIIISVSVLVFHKHVTVCFIPAVIVTIVYVYVVISIHSIYSTYW